MRNNKDFTFANRSSFKNKYLHTIFHAYGDINELFSDVTSISHTLYVDPAAIETVSLKKLLGCFV